MNWRAYCQGLPRFMGFDFIEQGRYLRARPTGVAQAHKRRSSLMRASWSQLAPIGAQYLDAQVLPSRLPQSLMREYQSSIRETSKAGRDAEQRLVAEEGRWVMTPCSSFDACCRSSCLGRRRRAEPASEEWRMRPVFVLAHSLYVGPLTCGPVADALAVRQDDSVILSLLDVANADPPLLSPGGGCGQRGDEPPRSRPMRAARGAQQGGPLRAVARQAHRPARPVLPVRRCRASRSSRADAG